MKKPLILKTIPNEEQIRWLEKNVGPRTHFIKNSIGGKGWRCVFQTDNPYTHRGEWELTFDKEAHASWYVLYWS